MLPLSHYFVLSLLLLTLGAIGVLLRRSPVISLFSVELILIAATVNLVAFSRFFGESRGQVFAVIIVLVAIAQCILVGSIIRNQLQDQNSNSASETETGK